MNISLAKKLYNYIKRSSRISINFKSPLFLSLGATDLTAVGENGDVQASVNTTTTESTDINAYSVGGAMYFYSGDEIVSI